MLVTLAGIVIEVRVENSKDHPSMLVTLLGMAMVFITQKLNEYCAMLVTLLGMTVFLQPTISLLLAVSMMALQFFLES